MKRLILLLVLIAGFRSLQSQYKLNILVKDITSLEALTGVTITVKNNSISTITNAKGQAELKSLPPGTLTIAFSHTGYSSKEIQVNIPDTSLHIILMTATVATLQDVTIVASTRTNDPVESATTKVEVLGIEEMNEESTLKPGNIGSILGDLSGIQIQQSAVTSGNANVRIQGLDGKYTQILRDGMPLYEG